MRLNLGEKAKEEEEEAESIRHFYQM